MSALTASLCSTLLFVGVFVFVSADQKTITADSGQDVTLTCRAPNNKITILEWSRADLGDENVFLHQEGHFVPDNQHPSFKNRVDLQDRQMKDGDVSLILKDVTINDSGTYECGVVLIGTSSWKSIRIINLSVVVVPGHTGGDTEDGSVGAIGGLSVWAVILLVVAFVIHRKYKNQNVVALFWNFVWHRRWSKVPTDEL